MAQERIELPLDLEIPDGLECPLTYEIMRDPVIAADGISYERSAIQKWLSMDHKGPVVSPYTKVPLKES